MANSPLFFGEEAGSEVHVQGNTINARPLKSAKPGLLTHRAEQLDLRMRMQYLLHAWYP